ncbi:hypothetical protein [Stutzerimonas stutzeri]|uniref:hypothetical protein n=1 Tax=Stutzerimonas stutzeri TaxID=316 RepID=UPI00210B7BBB|nr:hypothetical protein [Stutzerimonas stutzeri]MCQ4260928.1 hypothetical protein [Stutzerimonas stutzeri]
MESTKRNALASLLLAGVVLTAQAQHPSEMYEDCSKYRPGPGQAIPQEMMACSRRVQSAKAAYQLEQQKAESAVAQQRLYEASPSHGSMSYQRCILEEAPDVQNDLSARTVAINCRKHPTYARGPEADLIFGYDSAKECFADNGGQTQSTIASKLIAKACLDLYPGTIY